MPPDDSTLDDSPDDSPDGSSDSSIPNDPTPENIDEPEVDLLPDDPTPDDPAENIEPNIPEAPDLTDRDVPPELRRQFWSLVIIFNVALLAMSLGLMLIGFEGMWQLGGGIFLVGVFSFLRGWYGYKKVRKD